MTHNEIYTKFMIEYDKANVSSSYPSLTKYEAATLLDRAYLALISRKLTGNNTRKAPFEYDTKAIEDLRPLVVTKRFKPNGASNTVLNEYKYEMPDDLLYYIEGVANYGSEREIVLPVNHQIARKFKYTNSNIPWVNHPVSYIEGSEVYVLIDPFLHESGPNLDGTYIKKPASFVVSLKEVEDDQNGGNNGGGNGSGSGNNGGGNDPGGDTPGGNDNPPVVVAPPIITPGSCTFTTDVLSIKIEAAWADLITYRVNDGTWYNYDDTTKIEITEDSVIKAYAVLNNIASDTVQEVYTKQWPQEPVQEDPVSVTIQDCSYKNGAVRTSHIVHKGDYDGDLYQKLFAFNPETSTWRQVGYEMPCSTFDTPINKVWPLGQTNGFISTDTTLKVCIYSDNLYQNLVTSAQALILNMPISPKMSDPEPFDPNTQHSTLGSFILGESKI